MRPVQGKSLLCAVLAAAVIAFAFPAAAAAQTAPDCDTSSANEILRTGKPITLQVNCFDVDGDTVTVSHGAPDHGTLSAFTRNVQSGYFEATYTPTAGYTGPDDFTFTAHAGSLSSPVFGFDLTITENHAPHCETNGTFHAKVGQTIQVGLFCSDEDTQDLNLTYTATAGPSHGSLANLQGDQVDYTPTGGYTGEDSFTIRASDGALSDTLSQRLHVADTPMCSTPPAVQVRSGRSRDLTVDCTWPDSDLGAHRYAVVTPPSQGTLSPSGTITDPLRTYTANPGASGADSFTVSATGASGASPTVTQAITTGSGVNSPPVCDIDPGSPQAVYQDRPAVLFPNCIDPDDDQLTFTAGATPGHGTSTTTQDGVAYTADSGWLGSDSVPFTVSDGHGGSVGDAMPVNVNSPDPPSCIQGPIAVTVRPGRSVRLDLACFNPQGDPQTYSHTAAAKGTLGSFDEFGSVTYTADPGASGTDTFSLGASNVVGDSDPQPVTVTIDANYNRAPVCNDNTFSPKRVVTGAASTIDFVSVCSDPDGDPLTFLRQSTPAHGTASSGPASTLSYTSANGYLGPDSFAFTARDDRGAQAPAATEHIQVVASLAPSCAPAGTITLRPDQARSVGFNCSDPDFQTMTFKIVTPPNGTLSPPGDTTNPLRTYTAPSTGSSDSYTYRAVSSGGQSPVYTQSFTIDPASDSAPACGANSGFPFETVRDRARTMPIATVCADNDSDPLTFTRAAPDPQHGTATAANGVITYTPAPGYTGGDSFGYTVSDGHGGSATNVFTVNVVPPVPPSCDAPDALDVRPSQAKQVSLLCFDQFGDPVDFDITAAPTLGTLNPAGDGPQQLRTYTAGATEGDDAFSYRATNVNGTSNTVTQVVHVDTDTNTPPDCFTNSGFPENVPAGSPKTLAPFCDDGDGDTLSYTKLSDPAHGTLDDDGGTLVYTPVPGYSGPDRFDYKAADGHGGESAPTTHLVNVAPPSPPACTPSSPVTMRPNDLHPFTLSCSDAFGSTMTYVIDSPPARGALSGSGANRFFTAGSQEGDATFTWHAHSDATGDSATQTQVINIDASADAAPTCPASVALAAKEGVERTISPACTDGDGDTLTFAKQSDPAHGTLTDAGGELRYTADSGYIGSDSFTYRAQDGHGGQSAISTVQLDVTSDNQAPQCVAGPYDFDVPTDEVLNLPAPPCSDADGDTLTYETANGPAHGTLGAPQADGSRTYTPDSGYEGPDSFELRAFDGLDRSPPQTVEITVTPSRNNAPTCSTVTRRVAPGAATTVQLACSDPDGDPVTLEAVAAPSNGTLGAIDQGTDRVVYTPDPGYFGADSFTYRATDGRATGPAATATLDVTRAPACDDVSAETAVGAAVSVPLSCTDPDGDALTLAKGVEPAHGSLGSIAGGAVTYTPDQNYFGDDAFTYTASDGVAQSAPATVSITVTRAPSCDDVSRRTAVDATVSVPLTCSDSEGDALTLSIGGGPAHGTLGAIAGGAVTYTPDGGYSGDDAFTYSASDGTADSAPATVSIAVTRAPSCDDVARTTAAGEPVTVPLSCTDPEGDALTLAIAGGPSKGSLGPISGGSVTYTSDPGELGADSFTYTASDGAAESARATVSITITSAPTCADAARTTAVDIAVTVPLSCTDPEGDPLALSIADGPSKGTLGGIAGGAVTYTPDPGAHGADSFTYRANDGTVDSAPATVRITITRPPACDDVSVRTAVGAPVDVPLTCTDPDGDALTLSKVTDPAKGSLGSIAGGTVTYTPDAGEFGADSFTYRASDGTADSAPATADIEISRPPSCDDVARTTAVGASVSVPLSCSDPDGDPLALSIGDRPSKGSLGSVSGGAVTYTPDPGEFGADSFTFTANDDTADSAPATVSITITRAASCDDVSRRTAVDTAVTVPLTCTDPEDDALTLAIAGGPSKGSLGPISGSSVTYTPDPGEFGADSFTYTASDGSSDSAPATVSIAITRPPSCDDVSVRTAVETAVEVPLTCTDPDDDALTLAIGFGPSKGSLGPVSGASVTYTPDPGSFGADSFTYRAGDGTAESAPATVDLEVSRPPSCDDVSTTARAGTPVTIPLTCSDPEGDPLTVSTVTDPSEGTLGSVSGSSVTYTPDLDAAGQDSFTYRASDGAGASTPATVTIAITHPPRCDAVSVHTRVGTAVSVPLTCADADGDPLTLAIGDGPSNGSLGAISGGSVTYTPDDGAFGPDTFTYTANDGTSLSTPATATIHISRAPSCDDVSVRTAVGDPVSVPLACTDPDGDTLTYTTASDPSKGTLGPVSGASVTYTPGPGALGADAFTYTANDGDGEATPASVSITITRPPSCDAVSDDTPAGQPIEVQLSCADPDGDPITLQKVTGPAHGTLGSIDQGGDAVTYTPTAHYSGPDSFTYRASDGTAVSAPATVSLDVIPPPNTAPSCDALDRTVTTGVPTDLELTCTDPEGDPLTLAIGDAPAHGTLDAVDGHTVTYTSAPGYMGEDSFTFRASDGHLQSSPATVSLTVTAPPTVTLGVDHASAVQGSTMTFTATADDPDGGAIGEYRYTVDGTAVQTGASRTLSRRFDTPGTHTVTVRAKDDEGETATATKTVEITKTPASPPTGGGGTPAPTPGQAADTTPPSASLSAVKQKLKAVLSKGLALRASCSEPCTLSLQLVVDKKTARKLKLGTKATVIGTLTRSLSGASKLKVKLTAKARKKLKKARALKLSVKAVARDAAGNRALLGKTVKLKR